MLCDFFFDIFTTIVWNHLKKGATPSAIIPDIGVAPRYMIFDQSGIPIISPYLMIIILPV